MSTLEYTFNPTSDLVQNPTPILQQQKAEITTNPFIKPKSETQQKKPPTYNEINQNISKTVLGLIDDLFDKPEDIPWVKYIHIILDKDDRYNYIAVLIVFTILFAVLFI